ncbi:MAG: hypothetical protein LBN95_04270 [Prevotellaceae bacterium]|jgi:hypothetical protein|nr:hypothetical protein [Prevotellaceae bacterium]
MDGKYLIDSKKHIQFINLWVRDVVDNLLWNTYEDLHIDEIDKTFINKETWIDGSLYLRQLFLQNDIFKLYDLLLVISLKYKTEANIIPISINDLKKDLDNTPPSFYIYPKQHHIINETLTNATLINNFCEIFNCQVFYNENFNVGEYNRCIYII